MSGSWPPVAHSHGSAQARPGEELWLEARQAEGPQLWALHCKQHSLWQFQLGNRVSLTFIILCFQAGKH